MPQPLKGRGWIAFSLLVLAAGCQTSDPAREALVAQCQAEGNMRGETALEDCVRRRSAEQGETFRDRTGSCVKNCNR